MPNEDDNGQPYTDIIDLVDEDMEPDAVVTYAFLDPNVACISFTTEKQTEGKLDYLDHEPSRHRPKPLDNYRCVEQRGELFAPILPDGRLARKIRVGAYDSTGTHVTKNVPADSWRAQALLERAFGEQERRRATEQALIDLWNRSSDAAEAGEPGLHPDRIWQIQEVFQYAADHCDTDGPLGPTVHQATDTLAWIAGNLLESVRARPPEDNRVSEERVRTIGAILNQVAIASNHGNAQDNLDDGLRKALDVLRAANGRTKGDRGAFVEELIELVLARQRLGKEMITDEYVKGLAVIEPKLANLDPVFFRRKIRGVRPPSDTKAGQGQRRIPWLAAQLSMQCGAWGDHPDEDHEDVAKRFGKYQNRLLRSSPNFEADRLEEWDDIL